LPEQGKEEAKIVAHVDLIAPWSTISYRSPQESGGNYHNDAED
jgi:hypothetical protein